MARRRWQVLLCYLHEGHAILSIKLQTYLLHRGPLTHSLQQKQRICKDWLQSLFLTIARALVAVVPVIIKVDQAFQTGLTSGLEQQFVSQGLLPRNLDCSEGFYERPLPRNTAYVHVFNYDQRPSLFSKSTIAFLTSMEKCMLDLIVTSPFFRKPSEHGL